MPGFIDKYKEKGFREQEDVMEERREKLEKKEGKKERELKEIEKNLKKKLLEIKKKYSNLPLKDNARIDLKNEFFDCDFWRTERKKEKISSIKNTFEKKSIEREGEKLEILKTVLFDQFIGGNFYILRSSEYDDYYNGVDNILINKKTGKIVCAFDEVSSLDRQKENIKEKIKREGILEKNMKGGAKISYGFEIKEGEIKAAKIRNIPMFLIFLNKRYIDKTFLSFSKESENNLKIQKVVFENIIKKLKFQTEELINQSRRKRVNQRWKSNIEDFNSFLESQIKILDNKKERR